MRRAFVPIAVALALVAPAASASQKGAVVRVVKAYQKALLDGDGKKACSLMTRGGRAKLLQALPNSSHSCAKAADQLAASITPQTRRSIERARQKLSTKDVYIRGRHASAKLLSG